VRDRCVRVTAGDARASYDVVIAPGALARLGELAAATARASRYAVIADATVASLYGNTACEALARVGPAEQFTFRQGEPSKTRETWARLSDAMLERGLGRDACVVALGGGVTGDLAGFVAATYMRGLPWIQVPTSLLAMIDASIGGKTGVDVPAGKNLVGAFLQPRAVAVDTDLLATLPPDEFRNGLAEAVKHGAICDASYFAWIEENAAGILGGDAALLPELVQRSIEIKAGVVSADPHEHGQRASLNFGHTVAHAIERATAFGIPHGQAVAVGMVAEAAIGEAAGITKAGTAARLTHALRALGLPAHIPPHLDAETLLSAASGDKKARGSRLRWALISQIGQAARSEGGEWTVEISEQTVHSVLQSGPGSA